MGIALLCETLRERLRSVTRDWGLGIALLCETLRERLRSVTRDWGLGIGDWGLHFGSALLPGIGDWGLD
ncbi:MAG: hypothetical protein HEQ19_30165 [Gloeotrichia echinulata CP02]